MLKSDKIKYLVILLSLFLFLFILLTGERKINESREISFVYFLEQVKNNQVKEINLKSENEIIFKTKNNEIFITSKDPNSSLWEIFDKEKIPKENYLKIKISKIDGSDWKQILITLIVNFVPVIIIGWLLWQIFKQTQRGASQILSFGKSGIKVYDPNDPNRVTFKDVANLEEAKQELQEVIEFLKNPEKFLKIGARIPRGVLLVGAPGTGKTLLARACAAEAGVLFFYISGSEFVELFAGIGASRVRDAFAVAKKNQPCILFIDELDAIGRVRGSGISGVHEEREQTLNQILVEMDGFEKTTKVVVLAATNRPDVLDPALLRPGRFDRKIVLDLPDIKAREEILKIHLKDKKVGKINLKQIAQRTPGFSGADLANLCNEAAILAARRNKEYITQKELLDAIEKVLLGPERKTKVYTKKEKEIAAYHEAGHAIVAHYLPYASKVQKVSIIARSRAGGYTLKLPTEEKNFYFKKEFLDELASILGGYAAEKLIFKDVTTGAQNDLEIATNLAKQLVIRFGMSEKLGPVSFTKSQTPLLEFYEREFSEKTAEIIDEEVRNLINQALERATKVLEERKEKLEKVAQVLIKKEVIEKKEFERLLASN
ncbi:MAG: cell division protein FtsH [Patescibacteria group bacterium]